MLHLHPGLVLLEYGQGTGMHWVNAGPVIVAALLANAVLDNHERYLCKFSVRLPSL